MFNDIDAFQNVKYNFHFNNGQNYLETVLETLNEVSNSKIDISSKVDIWSIGVILFEMIYKKKPFGQNFSQDKLLKDRVMINARKVEFPQKPIISEECKEFIKNCLAYRSQDRYDVFQALNSSFIKQSNKYKNKKNIDGVTNNNLLNSNNNLHIYNNNSN